MTRRGLGRVLDEQQKRDVLVILGVGCSRRTAARYVGCSTAAIQYAADHDPDFKSRLGRAEQSTEFEYVKNIRNAARQDRYWRSAAWALERKNPDDFAPRGPGTLTLTRILRLFSRLVEIVVEEVPAAEYRKRVMKRVDGLLADLDRFIRKENGTS